MTNETVKLTDPFPFSDIDYRVDSKVYNSEQGPRARIVFYITARAVMDRLDACVETWSTEYVVLPDGQHVECRLTVDGVTRADVGEPSSGNQADAMKGAYSDAFKRAAVHFGIGRYLYKIPGFYAPVDEQARMTARTHQTAKQAYIGETGGFGEPDGPTQEERQAAKAPSAVSSPTNGVHRAPGGSQSRKANGRECSDFWRAWLESGHTRQEAVAALGKQPVACTVAELRQALEEAGAQAAPA